ncbi:cytochrome b/b6 domain-containing protein [Cognatazoarcus halotolerans]|uniref:cytochrome b/b6 domain-containing protein n=1 Tax=Cognatazoarcus halotolerans TaxID=2686016 RepID=UPI00135B4EF4|nr:cytochrome b/b6 domain-containing protein [Cognatazoarcus halotolerans]MCB1900036.1 cytochrome b/b6 domain-containing protein [Rhodocyclaceae bacterium]MCP5310283.1 cytochrome b/b6 domain-containing protein [Zoogloeaceae bacterium]MCP5353390.1 cytochrome b/b6 domain-containing protein [Chromatiales bacterium]
MSIKKIRLWDLPTRIFHWSLFLLVMAAIVTVKIGGNAMVWHGRIGVAIVGLLAFRIVWGLVGSTYARFANFVRGPGAIRAYLQGRWKGVGHNPLGALSVLALLGLLVFQVSTGLFANDDISFNGPLYPLVGKDTSDWLSGLHNQAEWFIYGLISLHVAAIVYYVRVKKDNIVKPMITGEKQVREHSVESARGGGIIALVVALAIAGGAAWAASGGIVPPPPPPVETPAW